MNASTGTEGGRPALRLVEGEDGAHVLPCDPTEALMAAEDRFELSSRLLDAAADLVRQGGRSGDAMALAEIARGHADLAAVALRRARLFRR